MKELEIVITSPPDREHCVAELWHNTKQVAEVFHDGESLQIEIYARPDQLPWRFLYKDFAEALESLKNQL